MTTVFNTVGTGLFRHFRYRLNHRYHRLHYVYRLQYDRYGCFFFIDVLVVSIMVLGMTVVVYMDTYGHRYIGIVIKGMVFIFVRPFPVGLSVMLSLLHEKNVFQWARTADKQITF